MRLPFYSSKVLSGIFGILMMLFSCEKTEDHVKPDEILFSNLASPMIAESVREWYLFDLGSLCSNDFPIPGDSSTSILLDINRDGEDDFRIAVWHRYFDPEMYCGHCMDMHEYTVEIQGINPGDSILCNIRSPIAYFNNSDTIRMGTILTQSIRMIYKNTCNGYVYVVYGEYIGFAHGEQLGWIKIQQTPNNGIIVENFAINLTERNPIIAGQVE